MRCTYYESILVDVARGRTADAETRNQALAHAHACDRCRTRLSDEHSLTDGLRVLAQETSDKETPARVEQALREAFRRRNLTVPRPVPAAGPATWPLAWRWWPVLAASVLLVLSLTAAEWWRSSPGAIDQAPAVPDQAYGSEERTPVMNDSIEAGKTLEVLEEQVATSTRPRRTSRAASGRSGRAAPAPAGDAEIATGFFPLTFGELPRMEGGQVQRIRVPRATLASFGLPMNADRSAESIPADILFGSDGMPRAIRFVRDRYGAEYRPSVVTDREENPR
ncbi:MAG: hypothetical protein HY650_11220 [Acidobacteria bacterium]|nr:hypothetical protein [Acidobacteriota bacterium]